MLRQTCASILLIAVALQTLPARATDHDTLNEGVWDPGTTPFGKTYAEWGHDWWNWGVREPGTTNPIVDETGESAHLNQDGPVFFLAGNFGGVTVRKIHQDTIAGKALLFPIVNAAWWSPEDVIDNGGDPSTMTHAEQEAFVRGLANDSMNAVSVLEATVDGVALQNLEQYRTESGPGGFVLDFPAGSLFTEFGLSAGPRDPTVSDGFWLMLDPLEPGQHEIHFHGVIGDPGAPDFEVEVTYEVVPEPSNVVLLSFGLLTLVGNGIRRRQRPG